MEFIFKDVPKILLCIFFCVFGRSVAAQGDRKPPFFAEKGFVVGYGKGIDTLNLPEGNYRIFYAMAHVGIDLFRNKPFKKAIPGQCLLYFEPQINPVFIKRKHGNSHALEFGVNVGFQHVYPLIKNFLSSYILIASGPHFITAHTSRQARGFLFSDNFGAGVYLSARSGFSLNLGFRLRHLSNGDTRVPNQGINTFNFHIGFSKFIR
jgi:hypothetical protein